MAPAATGSIRDWWHPPARRPRQPPAAEPAATRQAAGGHFATRHPTARDANARSGITTRTGTPAPCPAAFATARGPAWPPDTQAAASPGSGRAPAACQPAQTFSASSGERGMFGGRM